MAKKTLSVTFYGATREVTGANYLLEGAGKKILIDCGLIQGRKSDQDRNWDPFKYDPASIDILFITHAHVDHIGRIPKLIQEGFKGQIISTAPTKEITDLMLHDTMHLFKRKSNPLPKKIYTKENIKKAMDLWITMPYGQIHMIGEDYEVVLKDAGHVLGSAMIQFEYNKKKIVFTGDLGNSPAPLLRDTEKITDATYLIMESVYGDKNHEAREDRNKMLEDALEDTFKRKGALIIPTFSLERSQELLFEINSMVENHRIPKMPIFFDSPLAIKLTKIFKSHQDYFNKDAQYIIKSDDDIFNFPGLRETLRTEDSKLILEEPNPKVIIAGSGMSSGGRIIHHEKNYLSDPNTTLLLVGYQAVGTLGRRIEEGAKKVKILGEEVTVRARVRNIKGYSGHKDSDHLLNFVQDTSDTVKHIFAVMGEPKASMFLVQKIRDFLALNASVPERDEKVELEF